MPTSYRTKVVLKKLWDAARNAYRRCTDSTCKAYVNYGGRGIEFRFSSIQVCADYLSTLQYHDDLSLWIDRIDNNGHYEVGNIKFTTRGESQRNRRRSRPLHNNDSFNGVRYYIRHGFSRCFRRLINKGFTPKTVARLYCISRQTVCRVVGRYS